MSDTISFQLFATGGYINPTRRLSRFFWDADAKIFREKQDAKFDGGWRWYDSELERATMVYNKFLHPAACWPITLQDVNGARYPEDALLMAQSMCMVESKYYEVRDEVINTIHAMFHRVRRELGHGQPVPVHKN